MTMTSTPADQPTLPPVSPPPLQNGSGRNVIRVLIVAAAALLVLGGLTGLTAVAVGLGSTRVVTDSQPLPANLSSLTIDTGDLPVALRLRTDDTVGEPRVDLRFVSMSDRGQHTLAVSADGGDVAINLGGAEPDYLGWARGGEVTVVLPPQVAEQLDVTTTQEVGVLMADADVQRLAATTVNGAVILRGSARSMEIHNENGSINTRRPIEVRESFVANTAHGDIDVEFTSAPPETIEADAGSGSVDIGLPLPGPYDVTAESEVRYASNVSVDQTSDSSRAVATVVATSTSGSVTVEYTDDDER